MGSIARCLTLAVVFLSIGCSSMVNGTHQTVPVNSIPSGANVRVDCGAPSAPPEAALTTPTTVELKRKTQPCLLTLSKEGYEDASIMFARKVSGWVWGNVLFGGLVGWAIDGISGGMFYKVPETVQVEMTKGEASAPQASRAPAREPDGSFQN